MVGATARRELLHCDALRESRLELSSLGRLLEQLCGQGSHDLRPAGFHLGRRNQGARHNFGVGSTRKMVGAVEFFQFLLDGNWFAALYPMKGKVCGPDSRGGSCYWCLEEGLAPGDVVRISLEARDSALAWYFDAGRLLWAERRWMAEAEGVIRELEKGAEPKAG